MMIIFVVTATILIGTGIDAADGYRKCPPSVRGLPAVVAQCEETTGFGGPTPNTCKEDHECDMLSLSQRIRLYGMGTYIGTVTFTSQGYCFQGKCKSRNSSNWEATEGFKDEPVAKMDNFVDEILNFF